MRRYHWSTLLGALLGGLATLLLLGPVVVAVLVLRCCSDSTGPTWGAWALLLALLAATVAVGALVGGALGALLRRGAASLRRD